MNACIAGCIFSSVLPNLWKGTGALKIHGRYGDYTVCAFDVIVFTFRIGQQKVAPIVISHVTDKLADPALALI
jgi:hypothetical protein